MAVERGCGRRQESGQYLVTKLSATGTPIEEFYVDPVQVIDLDLPYQGVRMVEVNGVWHVFNHVGETHYPYPTDFIEEGKRFGFSTRAENVDYSKLTRESRIIHVHSKAFIEEWMTYIFSDVVHCPTGKHDYYTHSQILDPAQMCIGVLWYDFEEDDPSNAPGYPKADHLVRMRPSLSYRCYERPACIEKPTYQRAAFLSLPISGLEIVRGDKAQEKAERWKNCELPVEIVEE